MLHLSSPFNIVPLNEKNLCFMEHYMPTCTHMDIYFVYLFIYLFCIRFFPRFHQIELICLLANCCRCGLCCCCCCCCCNNTHCIFAAFFSRPNLFIRYICLFTAYITNSCIIITRCTLCCLCCLLPHSPIRLLSLGKQLKITKLKFVLWLRQYQMCKSMFECGWI